ncbi:hypothetical protein PTE_03828 [Photorhabdus khanii NC19]|uniref:Uncharacterized protein n=1 Tax=Photorhabdus khanii NC19 TaxID=1004151 RepID=W3V5U2_9GAMM|nr:hypothetical protein PTE_03828 [Photorhabdus khanii NC19]
MLLVVKAKEIYMNSGNYQLQVALFAYRYLQFILKY